MKGHTFLLRRVGAEFIGTYALVTAGCGAVIVNSLTGSLSHVGVALTFGLVIAVMVASVGHISGAHFNPAVTLAFALIRRFPRNEVPIYIAGQLLGAILGALTLRGLFGLTANLGVTLQLDNQFQALGMEVLLTAILMFVITAVATDSRAPTLLAAIAIGSAVALDALWGGPISGASMNPARSFGPALVAGVWRDHWIYWIGPILGASLGALIYEGVRLPEEREGMESLDESSVRAQLQTGD
jgi:aquaporin NIP